MNKKTNKISLHEAEKIIITMQKKLDNQDAKKSCKHIDKLANVLLKEINSRTIM